MSRTSKGYTCIGINHIPTAEFAGEVLREAFPLLGVDIVQLAGSRDSTSFEQQSQEEAAAGNGRHRKRVEIATFNVSVILFRL